MALLSRSLLMALTLPMSHARVASSRFICVRWIARRLGVCLTEHFQEAIYGVFGVQCDLKR